MARGRRCKQPKVLSGLRNQPISPSDDIPDKGPTNGESPIAPNNDVSDICHSESEDDAPPMRAIDSLKVDFAREEIMGGVSDTDEQSDWEELDDQIFSEALAAMILQEDAKDTDWIPEKFRRKANGKGVMFAALLDSTDNCQGAGHTNTRKDQMQ
jgi:hypothetical protein